MALPIRQVQWKKSFYKQKRQIFSQNKSDKRELNFKLTKNEPLRLKVLEIVGIHKGNNGRTCGIHSECGKSLEVQSQLKLHWGTISIAETVKESRDIIPEGSEDMPKKRGRKKKLMKEVVETVKIRTEKVVKALIWKDGVESCLVGFVSRAFCSCYGESLEGRVVEITQLMSSSEHECERERSANVNGLARATIMG